MRDAATLIQAPPNDTAPLVHLLAAYRAVRNQTERLCKPLEIEDYVIQSMPEASPVKWHLAHTTWFFEEFVLTRWLPGYRRFHPEYSFLFNSYYESVGPRWSRPERGVLSRPTVRQVYDYRAWVDEQMADLLGCPESIASNEVAATIVLGLNHEQQHQELILTDLKNAWAANPLHPVYRPRIAGGGNAPALSWLPFAEGVHGI